MHLFYIAPRSICCSVVIWSFSVTRCRIRIEHASDCAVTVRWNYAYI